MTALSIPGRLAAKTSDPTTIVDIVSAQADSAPERIAFHYLNSSAEITDSLSVMDLVSRAQGIGERLRDLGCRGRPVVLALPCGPEAIASLFGCFYAGAIGVPTPALDAVRLKRTLPRIQSIIESCRPTAILTSADVASAMAEIADLDIPARNDPSTGTETWPLPPILVPSEINAPAGAYHPATSSGSDAAYLQYSSGSTRDPKGVRITFDNLTANTEVIRRGFDYRADSVAVSWMPHFHDYGLVNGLLTPLALGIAAYVIPPTSFIRRPAVWLRAISRYGATHSGGPNFAYALCTAKVDPELHSDIALHTWRVAHSGAEPIRRETVEAFEKRFAPLGLAANAFRPAYGLAEATLLVTAMPRRRLRMCLLHPEDPLAAGDLYQCGAPIGDIDLRIVDPQTRRCRMDAWVRSGSAMAA